MTDRTASNIKNRYIKYLGISLAVFAYYAGEFSIVSWLASVLILGLQVRRLPNWLLAYTILLVSFFVVRILIEASAEEDVLRDVRFFWGFVFFLPFFISEHRRLGHRYAEYAALFRVLINLSLILLLIEFMTANLFSLEWPNRSHELGEEPESGFIARAYGFGGNSSVTSTLLISLGTLLYSGKFMRDIATLGLTPSGTGFLVFLMKSALMLKTRQFLMAAPLLVIFCIAVWVFFFEIGLLDSYNALGKFSLDYLVFLIDLKYEQYQSVMAKTNEFQLFFGQTINDPSLRTGDFQMLDFIIFNGLLGLGMLILIVAKCMNKINWVPLFLVLGATVHYQVMFSLPGQILFAWLLTVGMRAPQQRFKSTNTSAVHPINKQLAARG